MKRKWEHTEADLQEACRREMISWERLSESAQRVAFERLINENQAEQKRLIAENEALDTSTLEGRAEYLKRSDRLTRVFAEHDKLLELAYPRV